MKKTKKINSEKEAFEFGVDSRYKTNAEADTEALSLMKARLERMKYVTKDQVVKAKLIQLRLKMEDYLKQPVYDNQNHFARFLESYIDAIYSRRIDFAKDINVSPVYLSQIINNHRDPKEEFILKLMIHSEKAFKHIVVFHENIWFQVYFHEKICDTMNRQDVWRPKIEKEVKLTEPIG
ncbi:MAG: helix-turn-helix domain-containing protein [Bacteroidetes bacterium]|nr:helix-turn-helix domain-containing protein [Bacteroidota bacterium]